MKLFARIANGTVAELLSTDLDPSKIFHPALQWREVTTAGVAIGWVYDNRGFSPPPPVASQPVALAPSLAQLQSDLAVLTARLAAFAAKSGG